MPVFAAALQTPALPAVLRMLIFEYAEYHPLIEYSRAINYGRFTLSFGNECFCKKTDVMICEDSITFDISEADYVNSTPLYREQLLVWYRDSLPALQKIDEVLAEIFPEYRLIQDCVEYGGSCRGKMDNGVAVRFSLY